MSILSDLKEYIKQYYGLNARYKGYDDQNGDFDNGHYEEQNIIVINPSVIRYSVDSRHGIIGKTLEGTLCIYLTEERMKEDLLFEKFLLYDKDTQLQIDKNFQVYHFQEEILEVAVGFIFMQQQDFDREVSLIEGVKTKIEYVNN